MNKLAYLEESNVDYEFTVSGTPKVTVEIEQYIAAETNAKNWLADIGLNCIDVKRGYVVNGPSGPALIATVTTTGTGWSRGTYLILIENDHDEPLFLLDTGNHWAYRKTISDDPDARQWKYPWPVNHHLPRTVQDATLAAFNILAR